MSPESETMMGANEKNDRERRVEKATVLLTLAADSGKASGPCLSDEEMAALVEGHGSRRQVSELWAHLSACQRCYDEWLLLKKSLAAEKVRVRSLRFAALKKLRYIGTALAAAASIAVYLNVVRMEESPPRPETARQMILPPQEKPAVLPSPSLSAKAEKKGAVQEREALPEPRSSRAPLPAVPPPAGVAAVQDRQKVEPLVVPPQDSPQVDEGHHQSLGASPKRMVEKAAEKPLGETARLPAEAGGGVYFGSGQGQDLDGWMEELRQGCLSGGKGDVFWENLAARGRQLQALLGNSENKQKFNELQILLALLQGIHGAETEAVQCRRILEALGQRKSRR